MAVIRWEPAHDLNTLQSDMNRLFSTFFDSPAAAAPPARRWVPAIDIVEQERLYVLRADLPGLTEEDISVEVDGDTLTVSGERRAQPDQTGAGFVRLERASGAFSRSLTLPAGLDADALEATLADGVLELRIPKPEAARPRKVAIAVGGRPHDVTGTETAALDRELDAALQEDPQPVGA